MKKDFNSDLLKSQARVLFQRLVRISKRNTSLIAKLFGIKKNILDLKTLISVAPNLSENPGKIEDIKVELIIGTENRSQDFTGCFYPRREWMAERWIKIYRLMHSSGIKEPIKLIEYGGYYFVRDGNHRVSVAMNSNIEFLTAEVTHYRIPFNLPENLNCKNLDLFFEKYFFHQRTKIFNLIDDKLFMVNCSKTWKKLEIEIFEHSRSWFVRYFGRQPVNSAEFITTWVNFYKISVEHIRQRSLLLFFPGMGETDVFVEIVEFWNSYENPDSFWAGEIYEKFEKYIQKKRIILWLHQSIARLLQEAFSSSDKAKSFFLHSTLINLFIPDFNVPQAGKQFFNICYKQIFLIYARLWMDKKNKQPGLADIDRLWYDTYYKPILDRYRNRLYQITFEKYFILFSKKYYQKIIHNKTSMQKCLDDFEKKIVK